MIGTSTDDLPGVDGDIEMKTIDQEGVDHGAANGMPFQPTETYTPEAQKKAM